MFICVQLKRSPAEECNKLIRVGPCVSVAKMPFQPKAAHFIRVGPCVSVAKTALLSEGSRPALTIPDVDIIMVIKISK